MKKPTNSVMVTAARMRWSRPTVSMYCAQSGIRDVVDLLEDVPDKLSMDKLECWVWDQVYTLDAIPVLSLAMCMVIDVVFPVNEKRSHQNCWAGALIANLSGSAWCGEASCGLAVRSSTEVGMPCSSYVASKVVARKFLIPRVHWCFAFGRCVV